MNYSPARTLVLFFLGLVTFGVVFLSLPAARNFDDFSFFISLFTSVSAVSVTGFSVVNIGEYYSTFGQVIILILVQFGGIGYMFVSTVVTLLLGKMTLKDRRMMQEMFDVSSFNGLKKLLSKAVFFVLVIESVGAIVLTIIFLRDLPFFKAIYFGIFYSITSFCNSGLSLFNDSIISFANYSTLLCVLAILIMLGGLGFFVIVDVFGSCVEKRLHLSTHTKVVFSTSIILTFFAFLLFLFSDSVKGHGVSYLLGNAFFQSVNIRTAGFYSVPVNLFNEFTEMMLILFMSVGASSGSTGGGIKVTTLALVFVFVKSVLKGDKDFVLFKRRIPVDLVKKSLAVFIIFFTLIAFFSVILILQEKHLRPIAVVFEVVSAFATVGLSLDITSNLSVLGKIYILIAMIVGRMGILTLLVVMLDPVSKKRSVKYPEGRILVG